MYLTPRSLFNIILKVFGLFFLREIIMAIPEALLTFSRFFYLEELAPSVTILIVQLIILFLYGALVMQLILRTNKIIDFLKLDRGFSENEFSFEEGHSKKINLTTQEILNIALIILGGLILVNEIPGFCRLLYLFIDENKSFYGSNGLSVSNMVASVAKILSGLLILGERERITGFILKKKTEEDPNELEPGEQA